MAWATDFDKDDEAQIIALQHHRGFQALMGRFELQKRALCATLQSSKHTDIRAVDNLQAGIHWITFLQREVAKQTRKKEEPKYYEDDMTALVKAAIIRVGPQE